MLPSLYTCINPMYVSRVPWPSEVVLRFLCTLRSLLWNSYSHFHRSTFYNSILFADFIFAPFQKATSFMTSTPSEQIGLSPISRFHLFVHRWCPQNFQSWYSNVLCAQRYLLSNSAMQIVHLLFPQFTGVTEYLSHSQNFRPTEGYEYPYAVYRVDEDL